MGRVAWPPVLGHWAHVKASLPEIPVQSRQAAEFSSRPQPKLLMYGKCTDQATIEQVQELQLLLLLQAPAGTAHRPSPSLRPHPRSPPQAPIEATLQDNAAPQPTSRAPTHLPVQGAKLENITIADLDVDARDAALIRHWSHHRAPRLRLQRQIAASVVRMVVRVEDVVELPAPESHRWGAGTPVEVAAYVRDAHA